MLKSWLLSRRFQMCLESSVLLVYRLFLNVALCWVYLCLNVPSVNPI